MGLKFLYGICRAYYKDSGLRVHTLKRLNQTRQIGDPKNAGGI